MSPNHLQISAMYKFRLVPPPNIGHATALLTTFYYKVERGVVCVEIEYDKRKLLTFVFRFDNQNDHDHNKDELK